MIYFDDLLREKYPNTDPKTPYLDTFHAVFMIYFFST